ncbi:TetR/AcrR family transcriptional regulator [Phytoactinopolyspora mesophila]|uniref:TetR family transcriptional regulator n=1 Tax=Phytoactinopolyspora mesophila TaxID=2650750 RepID=A0A7K3LY10_9ACTN|nr:TetR/AcrR family transcriptional regulator [Phytoactinopolyspora mesophila]NDL55895.1 TetR family transcriptional regulator [Phytoactinopolyspora mesophila]
MTAADQSEVAGPSSGPHRRMRRAERRAQILDAATKAFARSGFAATSLDHIVTEAGITRVLLYRHFDSKADMYRAVLERACERLVSEVGDDNYDADAIPALLRAASADPEGFRLLFHHAAREPEFRGMIDDLNSASAEVARRNLAKLIPAGPWLDWAAQVVPAVTIESVIGWLDAGQPDPDSAADRVAQVVGGVIRAAAPPAGES